MTLVVPKTTFGFGVFTERTHRICQEILHTRSRFITVKESD